MKKLFTLLLFSLSVLITHGQVITTSPPFPKHNDNVTITFDASKGNGALAGVSGAVYAHTGVITTASSSKSDWKYVQGTWGTTTAPLMTNVGGDKYTLDINTIRSFYGVPSSEDILQMAFVFRNLAGDIVGRATGGGDIYVDVYATGLSAAISAPINNSIQTVGNITISGLASESADMKLFVNGTNIKSATGTSILHNYSASSAGNYMIVLEATSGGTTIKDTSYFVINPSVSTAAVPLGAKLGVNYTSSSTATFVIDAPYKNNIYLIGDFNNWTLNTDYFMKKDPGGSQFWITVSGLVKGTEYAYQYLIDGDLKIADPCSELVLDPSNDQWIPEETFPNLHPYPTGKTSGMASLFEAGKTAYSWETSSFTAPKETDLVIYELLPRDFVAAHDYKTIMDSLDYLENLGINAIQFMPVNEFEGNESWGYNPSFHMALDKYYGSPTTFKKLIDECHKRGMAVILDVVYNHAFSQSPLCQMYWDAAGFKPSGLNPFLNTDAKHDFNVGYDFDHDNPHFRAFMKRSLEYWLTEYKVDGFRFDLSKGFTQKNSLGNVAAWGNYDQTRVDNIKRIYSEIKAVNSNAYVILEHFADNNEEKVLANDGLLLWGNLNHEFGEANMGYSGSFNWASYKNRGWNNPKAIGYAESHDEERLTYKAVSYGKENGGYKIKNLNTALSRMELSAVFLMSIPGPKMIWQFGELGYDYSIDHNGRVGNKPIKWGYFDDVNRKSVYNVYSAINKLRVENDAFEATNYSMDVSGSGKRIHLNGTSTKAVVLGNFDVSGFDMAADFQHTGMWYELFSGDSLNVTDASMTFYFEPGEYMVWLDKRIHKSNAPNSIKQIAAQQISVYPNPVIESINLNARHNIDEVIIYTVGGVEVKKFSSSFTIENIDVSMLSSGSYMIKMKSGTKQYYSNFIKL